MPTLSIRATLKPTNVARAYGSIRIYIDLEVSQDLYNRYEGIGYSEGEAEAAVRVVEDIVEAKAAELMRDGLIVRDWYNLD